MEAQRIILKIGTAVLTGKAGEFTLSRLQSLLKDVKPILDDHKELIIVTSGAVGLGRKRLGLRPPLSLEQKQGSAAVGQSLLMRYYNEVFEGMGYSAAQILLTSLDLADRKRYLNLQKTLSTLLSFKAIPVINENDVVSVAEIEEKRKSFGDNDKLSALVAAKLNADLLIILTDVDGVYDENPVLNPQAKRIPIIKNFQEMDSIITAGTSSMGRGGMSAKLVAAKIAAMTGANIIIAPGNKEGVISHVYSYYQKLKETDRDAMDGKAEELMPVGTLIYGQEKINTREHWIGYSSGYEGILVVDEGAKKALIYKNSSLLVVGIIKVDGEFLSGKVVSVQDSEGFEIGRGVATYSSDELSGLIEKSKSEKTNKREVIHKNNLVLFVENEHD